MSVGVLVRFSSVSRVTVSECRFSESDQSNTSARVRYLRMSERPLPVTSYRTRLCLAQSPPTTVRLHFTLYTVVAGKNY